MENRIIIALLIGATVLAGTQITQAGDWSDDAVTYYMRKYRPRVQEYDTNLRMLRSFKRNPADAAKYEQFVKDASYFEPRDIEFRKKHASYSGRVWHPKRKISREQAISERKEFDTMLNEWDKEREQYADTTAKNYWAVPYKLRDQWRGAVPENIQRRMEGADEPFDPAELNIRANIARKVDLDRPTWGKVKQGAREGYGRFTNYIKSFYR